MSGGGRNISRNRSAEVEVDVVVGVEVDAVVGVEVDVVESNTAARYRCIKSRGISCRLGSR